MATPNHLHKIAIVGGSGNLGGAILGNLLASKTPTFQVTAIARAESTSPFPSASNLEVVKGSLEDLDFLTSALRGQDAVILTLGFGVNPGLNSIIVKAAAAAGVPWVVPTEFGHDTTRMDIVARVPPLQHKVDLRKEITALGVGHWIAIVTNPWLDFGLMTPGFNIDVRKKEATLLDGGNIKTNTTTIAQAGLAVSRTLALPIKSEDNGPSLEDYKDGFVYINSFRVTQREMLEGVQEVFGKDGWTVTEKSLAQEFKDGNEAMAAGDMSGLMKVLYGTIWEKGGADEYSGPLANSVLNLPQENFTDVVKEVQKKVSV